MDHGLVTKSWRDAKPANSRNRLLGSQERVLRSFGMECPEELEALGQKLSLLQPRLPPYDPRIAYPGAG